MYPKRPSITGEIQVMLCEKRIEDWVQGLGLGSGLVLRLGLGWGLKLGKGLRVVAGGKIPHSQKKLIYQLRAGL